MTKYEKIRRDWERYESEFEAVKEKKPSSFSLTFAENKYGFGIVDYNPETDSFLIQLSENRGSIILTSYTAKELLSVFKRIFEAELPFTEADNAAE
jgi:hypothetical protein